MVRHYNLVFILEVSRAVHVIWSKTTRSNVDFGRIQRWVKKYIEMGQLVDFFFKKKCDTWSNIFYRDLICPKKLL